MQFAIGPWTYDVVIAEDRLFDEDGGEIAGRCSSADRRIEISATVHPRQRLEVLVHELRHAWCFHLGRPLDDEGDANNASAFVATCMFALQKQGGERQLMAMRPDGAAPAQPEPPAAAAAASSDGQIVGFATGGELAQCFGCRRSFAEWEVVSEHVDVGPGGVNVVPRSVYCESCGHVLTWCERTLDDVTPNGQLLGPMRRLTGAAVTDWLRQHGERVGVVMV